MAQISKNILLTDTKQARQEKGSEKGVLFCFWKEIREVNGGLKEGGCGREESRGMK